MTLVRALVAELARDPEALEQLRSLLQLVEGERLLKADEAADRLGVNPQTLTRAASQGRVKGAVPIGTRNWRFRASELELLPPGPRDLPAVGPGRRTRRPGTSSATASIRGTDRKAA